MRPRSKWIVVAIALCFFASSAWAADKASSGKKSQSSAQSLALGKRLSSDLSLEELDRMESRIKALKKKIKIQELKNKLNKMKPPQDREKQGKKRKKLPKKLLDKLSGKGGPPQSPGKAPGPGGTPGAKAPKTKAPGKGAPKGQNPPPPNSPRSPQADKAKRSRVVSVTGFGDDIRAKIALPGGGETSVSEGDETRIGTVEAVSLHKVIVESDGEKKSVPLASQLSGRGNVKLPSAQAQGGGEPLPEDSQGPPAPVN